MRAEDGNRPADGGKAERAFTSDVRADTEA